MLEVKDLFEAAVGLFPREAHAHLLVHYRSRHQALIEFSNHASLDMRVARTRVVVLKVSKVIRFPAKKARFCQEFTAIFLPGRSVVALWSQKAKNCEISGTFLPGRSVLSTI
jgi:hypothetical protein